MQVKYISRKQNPRVLVTNTLTLKTILKNDLEKKIYKSSEMQYRMTSNKKG